MSKYNFNKDVIYEQYISQNLTLQEVAELNNASVIAIQRYLRKEGIKKKDYVDYDDLVPKISKCLDLNMIHKDIAKELNITLDKLRHIIYKKINPPESVRGSNKLISDDWISNENYIYWYIVGIISSDGHLDKNNCVEIFQSNVEYLKLVQSFIGHKGNTYKRDESYILIINNESLYNKLQSLGIDNDKRYNVPFLQCPDEYMNHYIRGLFDGDGCLYYRYTSGMFDGKTWQYTTGSHNLAEGLKNYLENKLSIKVKIHKKMSQVNNEYYDVIVGITDDILKLCEFMYSNNNKLLLKRKYKSFIKLKNLIRLDKHVNDIVDAALKNAE